MKTLCAAISTSVLLLAAGGAARAVLVGTDIGTLYPPDPAGAFHCDESATNAFTVSGAGKDIWGESDSFFYVHEQDRIDLTEFVLTVHVTDFHGTNPGQAWQKAGLMVRNTLDEDSQHASSLITSGNGYDFLFREATGGDTSGKLAADLSAPIWLRLQRDGDVFTGYWSENANTWVQGDQSTVAMDASVYYGLAVSSRNQGDLSTAVFEQFDFTVLQDLLTWDGKGLGNWNSTGRWNGGNQGDVPGPANRVVVRTDTVTVAAAASAFGVSVDSGGVLIADGRTLTIGTDGVNFAAHTTLTLGADSTLSVAGGGVIHSLLTAGNANVHNGGDISVDTLHNDGNSGEFTKRGTGALRLDNSSGSGVSAVGTVFNIESGLLISKGSDPLGGATEVTLAGGGLSIEGQSRGNGEPIAALDLADTAIRVADDSTLEAITDYDARFASLIWEAGTLTINGANHGVHFNRMSLAADAESLGLNLMVDVDPGIIDAGSNAAVISKDGPGDLLLKGPNTAMDNVTFDLLAGRLIGVPSAIGTASLRLSGGELVLAGDADGTDAAFRAPTVLGDSTLRAGSGGIGGSGPLFVTLGTATEGVVLTEGTLSLRTSDNYRLRIPGTVAGNGGLDLTAGRVTIDRPISTGRLHMTGGELIRTGAGTPNGDVSVSNSLMLVSDSLNMTGSTLTTGPKTAVFVDAGRELKVDSRLSVGSLEVAGAVSADGIAAGNFDVRPGGVVNSSGPITADNLNIAGRLNLSGTAADKNVTISPGGSLNLEGWNLNLEGATLAAEQAHLTIGFGRSLVYDRALTVASLDLSGSLARRAASPQSRALTIAPGGRLTLNPGTRLNMTGLTAAALTTTGAHVEVHDAELTVANPISANSVTVTAGSVDTSGGMTVDTMKLTGGVVNTNSSHVTIGNRLELGETAYAISEGDTFAVSGSDLLDGFDLTLFDGGTLRISGPAIATRYGLQWGRISARDDETTYPDAPLMLTPDLADTEITHNDSPPFGDNETHVFTGYFFDEDGLVSFRESCNDEFYLKIDGEVKMNDDLWSNVTTACLQLSNNPALPVGWHEFEMRLSNGGGSAGPVHGRAFSFDADGGTGFAHPLDTGDASMFAPNADSLVTKFIDQSSVYITVTADRTIDDNARFGYSPPPSAILAPRGFPAIDVDDVTGVGAVHPTTVPEPGEAVMLIGVGVALLVLWRRR